MPQVYFSCSSAERILPNRAWVLHVSDDLGEEIFALPFSSIMGRLH